jgi:GT2 family glycosyltransferase
MKTNLSVIIPTLNNTSGVSYLLKYFKDKPYKIKIIDNKSKNLGFAGGVNKGAKKVETKWMLILNDDIEFYDSVTIEHLIKFAEKENIDAVSPVLVNPNGEVENYGYKILSYGKVQLIKNYEVHKVVKSIKSEEIDGLTAACLLIKTSIFKKLDGFDESFFAYLEDVDLFLRMKKIRSKFDIAYDIKVFHHHMMTSKTMGNFKAKQDMINWWRLYFKHKNKFEFNINFLFERLRNASGYIKATFPKFFFS